MSRADNDDDDNDNNVGSILDDYPHVCNLFKTVTKSCNSKI